VLERIYNDRFIRSPNYGTRASTVLLLAQSGIATVCEQNFDNDGAVGPLAQYEWPLDPAR
jgi:uncharacterized protein with NRDE domain